MDLMKILILKFLNDFHGCYDGIWPRNQFILSLTREEEKKKGRKGGRRGDENKREEKKAMLAQGSRKKVTQALAVGTATMMDKCMMKYTGGQRKRKQC